MSYVEVRTFLTAGTIPHSSEILIIERVEDKPLLKRKTKNRKKRKKEARQKEKGTYVRDAEGANSARCDLIPKISVASINYPLSATWLLLSRKSGVGAYSYWSPPSNSVLSFLRCAPDLMV